MSDKVRVLRILEYVGDREWVEVALQKTNVPIDGIKIFGKNNENIIKSCIIDKFPEILNKNKDK
ncbi:hypothetical protein [Clostridium sporogenes]|uniref:hypothetical protein n=1 Tax=Clostridium sporogenes TaxID=1509 RepID=UPI0013D41CDB|nr:hypothetical protein [Clostridium sporogenes]NFH40819.1 hypothetical protein [Clostridium sporogenes]